MAVVIWKGVGWLYRHQIGNLNSTIAKKDAHIAYVEKNLDIERQSQPLTPLPGAEPDAPQPAISLDPDVINVMEATRAAPIMITVNPMQIPENWGKTLSTNEMKKVAAVEYLFRHEMVSVEPAGEGSYTATSTATATNPDVIKQIVEKMAARPVPKLKRRNFNSQQPDEDDENSDED